MHRPGPPVRLLTLACACLALSTSLSAQLTAPRGAPGEDRAPTPVPRWGEVALSVMDDALHELPFAPLTLAQGGVAFAQVTDAHGHGAPLGMVVNAPVEVLLDETGGTAASGLPAVSIGQRFSWTPSPGPGDADSVRLVYCQPVARRVTLGAGDMAVHDPEAGWVLGREVPGSLTLQAWVSELVTRDVVSHTVAYATGFHDKTWRHGVLLRCDQLVDLSAEPLVLMIDREGYDYGLHGPVVGTRFLGDASLGNGLGATLIDPPDATSGADWLHVRLTGALHPGDNLVLIRDQALQPPLPAPPLPPGVVQLTTSGECEPPQASCSTPDCSPSTSGCKQTQAVTCKQSVVPVGARQCADCGTEKSDTTCTEYEGGVVVSVGVSTGPVKLKITASGKVTGRLCTTTTALPGHCAQGWFCYKTCRQKCLVTMKWKVGHEPYEQDVWRVRSCVREGTHKSTGCQHTDCP